MKCIKCKAELNDEARFCDACGASQKPGIVRCRNCDAEIMEGAKSCSVCGARQSTEIENLVCYVSLLSSFCGLFCFCMRAYSGHFDSAAMVALMCLLFVAGGILGAFAVCRKRYLGIAAIALAIVMPLVVFGVSYNAEKEERKKEDELHRELNELRKFKEQQEKQNIEW